jgi:hypothetical protein
MAEHRAVDSEARHVAAGRPAAAVPTRAMAPSVPATAGMAALSGGVPLVDGATGAQLVASLQGTLGNASVHALLTAQRHAEGAALGVTQDQPEAVAELTSPPPLLPATGGAGAATAPPAAPASPPAMSLAAAQQVLTSSYGTVKQIVPGNIVLLEGRPALWARYDQITKGRTNPYVAPNRPWQDGDAQQYIPGLEGFADSDTHTVYIDAHSPLPTVTAHEMLHINTAPDFRGRVGETVNEGTTEYLALKALTAAGVSTAGTGGAVAYPTQRTIVQSLIGLVGEGTLIQAYFGGAEQLVATYEALEGRSGPCSGRGPRPSTRPPPPACASPPRCRPGSTRATTCWTGG